MPNGAQSACRRYNTRRTKLHGIRTCHGEVGAVFLELSIGKALNRFLNRFV